PARTTMSALGDDQLREIFLRLPDLPSLAAAAFTCRAFLGAVRSSRAFRRRFRELHAPPLLALFLTPCMHTVPAFPSSRRPSAGFSPLRDHAAASDSEWGLDFRDIAYNDGFICIEYRTTKQQALYNPQTTALILRPKEDHDMPYGSSLEFHTLPPEEDQRPSRVVCVRHDYSWAWVRVAVLSSDTMEWQVFPETATPLPEGSRHAASTVVDGFICWEFVSLNEVSLSEYILVLNTDTFQFSRVDLPPPLRVVYPKFKIGQTKDRNLCIVIEKDCTLFLWICTAGDDGVQRFVLHTELNQHFKNRKRIGCPVHPYLAWPPLVDNTVDSEYEVTGNSIGNVGPESTENGSSFLIKTLRSFKEALIKDDDANVAEIEAFLLCIDVKDEKNSLVRKLIALDELLITVRDRVLRAGADSEFYRLRAGADSEFYRQKTETESWWQMCKGKLWRAFFAS
uniref:F-box domain-containing protein n=1 Tax=Aegilops tauschii subsp. strangulata TaxID=200361 RepID=A0A453D159_AEGTS